MNQDLTKPVYQKPSLIVYSMEKEDVMTTSLVGDDYMTQPGEWYGTEEGI